jgi:NADP-dependent 3-hydroxy acid dehydrogenase YdfG
MASGVVLVTGPSTGIGEATVFHLRELDNLIGLALGG